MMPAAFEKPHLVPEAGRGLQATYYPYPDAWLEQAEDVFDVYLLDGGAFACTNEFLDQATGQGVLRALDDKTLLTPWQAPASGPTARPAPGVGGAVAPPLKRHVVG